MTVQQQVVKRVSNLSEEGAIFIEHVLNSMKPAFFVTTADDTGKTKRVDVSKRFGAGKGIIKNVDAFKSDNDEISKMFERIEK